MEPEYTRTELLLGEDALHKLKEKTVLVLGLGGVGSHCTEALARSGVGHLILVDNDVVEASNINRQSIALHSTLGRKKTEVMRERVQDICPTIEVTTKDLFLLSDTIEEVFEETPDYVVDAIDTVTAKLEAACWCTEKGIPILSSMGTGNKLHGEEFEIADISETSVDPLCRIMRKELKARGVTHLKVLYSKEPPLKTQGRTPGSIAFVPPVAGLRIAEEVIFDLLRQ